jgi:azurin
VGLPLLVLGLASALAGGSLERAVRAVLVALPDLPLARARLARIVGRQVSHLPEAEILRAAAETAAPAATAADIPVLEVTIKPDNANPLAYDTKSFTAKAGQKVKLTFENNHPTLPQPHNFVLGKLGVDKGKMLGLAMAAMTLVDKGYIPDSADILANTKLLQPGQTETIEFTLPTAGEYNYICTFPGHGAIMNGTITVQ